MIKIISISLGGMFGALMRYSLSGLIHRFFEGGFPLGTLGVNLLGSLLVGLLWSASEMLVLSQNTRLFLFIGVLGSFTTFSTFSLESFHLLRDGEYGALVLNITASVVLGIALVFAGYFLGKYAIALIR